MKKKAEDNYGPQVAECVEGISEGNLEEVAKCIANAINDASPTAIAEELAEWSVECAL